MSIVAMNWALRQRLPSPTQQILLYVIADSADPEGRTRYCDPVYMEGHARLPRSTMFRTLGELEGHGLLERHKFYSERGDVRYEIVLNFGVQIELPIRRRRKPGEEGDTSHSGDDAEDTQDEEMNGIPESHGETLVETDQSPTGTPAKSQSVDYHIDDPSLPKKESPPTPSGGRSRLEVEGEEKRNNLWERFKQGYPGIAAMDQHLAREELDALSLDEAEWATSVLGLLRTELAKLRDRPPKNAHLWLRKRLFENFPRQKLDAPPPEGVWIVEGSDEDRALRFLKILAKQPSRFINTRPDGARGYQHPVAVGLDAKAMLVFEAEVPLRWALVLHGSAEYAAWQQRFIAWIGAPLPQTPGEDGIRVPCQWPPSKEGRIYIDGDIELGAA